MENPVRPGTPDVNFVEGWIELKYMARWPKIPAERPVLMDHFTPQQRLFAIRRSRARGNIWFLMQVGKEYLLLTGLTAAEIVGTATKQQLIDAAVLYCPKGLDEEALIKWLTR